MSRKRLHLLRRVSGISVALLAFAASGCGEGQPGAGSATSSDPGPVHVHGLGINPTDGALLIATHTGLFRSSEGAPEPERVAGRYQDTMGFTVVGPDLFLGSGHPDGATDPDLPPFLGLIRSDDAGNTWDPVSLLGKVDFHLLESSGDLVYGYGSDFRTRRQLLLVSADGGDTWQKRRLPERTSEPLVEESLLAIALDPRDPSTVIASGQKALWISVDQGRRWRFLSADAGLLAWAESGALFLINRDGQARSTVNAGRTWSERGSLGGEPTAFEASGGALYAALHDGTIIRSDNDGETWTVRSRP